MNLGLISRLTGRPAELKALPVTLGYPRGFLGREAAKGAAGALLLAALLLALKPSPYVAWPLGVVAALFALYGAQQWRRRGLRWMVTEHGAALVSGGRRVDIAWNELERLRLHFHGFGRNAAEGTLTLRLSAGRRRIPADSSLEHFPTLLAQAAQVARERGLELDPTTEANLEQLGL